MIVSGEIDQWGPKTIVIGAEAEGTAVTPDLPGSFDGAVDHVRALERAGYTLTS